MVFRIQNLSITVIKTPNLSIGRISLSHSTIKWLICSKLIACTFVKLCPRPICCVHIIIINDILSNVYVEGFGVIEIDFSMRLVLIHLNSLSLSERPSLIGLIHLVWSIVKIFRSITFGQVVPAPIAVCSGVGFSVFISLRIFHMHFLCQSKLVNLVIIQENIDVLIIDSKELQNITSPVNFFWGNFN